MFSYTVKVTTESGHSWTTPINGTRKSIWAYFTQGAFNVGVFPIEKMEMVTRIQYKKYIKD